MVIGRYMKWLLVLLNMCYKYIWMSLMFSFWRNLRQPSICSQLSISHSNPSFWSLFPAQAPPHSIHPWDSQLWSPVWAFQAAKMMFQPQVPLNVCKPKGQILSSSKNIQRRWDSCPCLLTFRSSTHAHPALHTRSPAGLKGPDHWHLWCISMTGRC